MNDDEEGYLPPVPYWTGRAPTKATHIRAEVEHDAAAFEVEDEDEGGFMPVRRYTDEPTRRVTVLRNHAPTSRTWWTNADGEIVELTENGLRVTRA